MPSPEATPNTDHPIIGRCSLILPGIDGLRGANALSSVLRGARPVSSHSNWYREYLKTGGDIEAVDDFYRARPTHVTDYELPGGVSRRWRAGNYVLVRATSNIS